MTTALRALTDDEVQSCFLMGKTMLEAPRQGADETTDAQIDEMCRQLLANTVIENYRVERA